MKRLSIACAVWTFSIILAVGAGGCVRPAPAESVTVLATWVDAEGEAFKKVLNRFTDKYHIRVDYQGTRAFSEVLRSAVDNGTPPDVAVLPSPGELANYVRGDKVRDLDDIPGLAQEDAYPRQWQTLQRIGGEHLYSITVTVGLKSLVWFNPRHFKDKPPQTWDELIDLSKKRSTEGYTPWCLGLGDGPGSGWSGTDWIEDILLHQSGARAYEMWSAGDLAWNSTEMRKAWTAWGEIVAAPHMVYGDANGALITDFSDAARPMFDMRDKPARCLLHRQATFMMGFYRGYKDVDESPLDLLPEVDFDFFSFPRFGSGDGVQEVSADLAAMFNETPQARKLMEFLATQEAQDILPTTTVGRFSANKKVAKNEVRPVSDGIADIITARDAVLCFDASDVMPKAMTNAFYRAILEYVRSPEKLNTILDQLEEVRHSIEASNWLELHCGR
jgi:alpha-glucoside transport system substrate-binding protein